jgi:hypothetical protein
LGADNVAENVARAARAASENAEAAELDAANGLRALPGKAVEVVEGTPHALFRAGRWVLDKLSTDETPHPQQRTPAHPQQPHPQQQDHMVQHSSQPVVQAQRPRGNEHYKAFEGHPFLRAATESSGVSPWDVEQGQTGDCWLMSGMAAVARADPASIAHLIKDLGGGKYEVTLYVGPRDKSGHPTARKVVVDNTFPVDSHGRPLYAGSRQHMGTAIELWPMLIEKALAVVWNGYEGKHLFNQGLTMRPFSAIDVLIGAGAGSISRFPTAGHSEDFILEHMEQALAQHKPITTLSGGNLFNDRYGVISWHHYAVASVDRAARTVSLQNPWGSNHLPNMKIADYVLCYVHFEIGPRLGNHAA